MDNHRFRAILLKLQDRLSDNDRKRLHFFIGNDVPRRIRDDLSLGGTLNLMESLFDQDKISEQDFTSLINAFDEIRCIDAVKLLREHMTRLRSNGRTESLASIMPNRADQLLKDDKYDVENHLIQQQNTCGNKSNMINSNSININPVTIVLNRKSKRNLLATSSAIQKWLLLFVLLLIIVLVILIGFYIHRTSRIAGLEYDLKMKYKAILEEQAKNNQTIEQLKNQLKDLKKEKSFSLIKAGTKFGGTGGDPFDHSLSRNFTSSHYLSGIVFGGDMFPLDWFQFLYSSPHDLDNIIETKLQGTRQETGIEERFLLAEDEKIFKIQVKVAKVEFYEHNFPQLNVLLTRDVRFFTTKGRVTPSIDHVDGKLFTEQFEGYILGYVTGRTGSYIDQLQFYWYRTVVE